MSNNRVKKYRNPNTKKRVFECGMLSPVILKQVNNLRKEIGLKPVEQKLRNCLKCDREFTSISPANRMCYFCGGRPGEHIEGGIFRNNGIHS